MEWEPADRAKLIAHLLEESQRCGMCGTAPWEWDPKTGGSIYAYEAMPMMCQGCLRRDALKDDETAHGDGIRITLVPSRQAQAMKQAPKRAPGRA